MNLFKNLLVSQVLPNYQFDSNVIFPPGVLDTSYDLDDYLSKLDSDTRDISSNIQENFVLEMT
jgi:hypothetical protein